MYINGRNAVIEAIRAGERIEKIYFLYGLPKEGIADLRREAAQAGVPTTTLDRMKFRRLEQQAELKTRSQGVIARINEVDFVDVGDVVASTWEKGVVPLIVALDAITDPHNIGAIIRTAECAGAQALVFSKEKSAGLSDVAIKSSAGAALVLPLARVTGIAPMLRHLHDAGLQIVGLDERAEKEYTEVDFTLPSVIVIGSEGEGMSSGVRAACTVLASIPMEGTIASLNASVASGVVLFEVVRQRRGGQGSGVRGRGREESSTS